MAATGTYYTYYKHSGSNTPRAADDGGDIRYYFKISETTDKANNTSVITSKCYTQTQSYQYLVWVTQRVNVDGVYKYVEAGAKVGSGSHTTYIGTTTHVVKHNSDGTGKCSWTGSGYFDGAYTYTSNAKFDLITIPRYANITAYNVAETGMESIKVEWNADASCDAIQYKLNNSSWIGTSGKTFNITGLSPNTTYAVNIRVKRTDSQLWTESSSKSVRTKDHARITSLTSEFDIGTDINVSFSNPSNEVVNLIIETLNPTQSRMTRNDIHSTYQLNFTEDENNLLYSLIPNDNEIILRVVLNTHYNGHVYQHWKDIKAKVVNQNPNFTTFLYVDENPLTIAVSGNNQKIIKNQSLLKIIIPSSNKMITKAYATPNKYVITCDEKSSVIDYSEDDIEVSLNEIASPGLKRIMVKAIDSRENEIIAHQDVMIYDYEIPSIITTAKRVNDFENQTIIELMGSFTLLNIDGSDKNTITTSGIKYRFVEAGNDFIDNWITVSRVITNENYNCDNIVLDLDNTKAYKIEIEVKDLLDKKNVIILVDVGQELMYLNSETGDLKIKGNFNAGNNIYGKNMYCQELYINNEKVEKFNSKYLPRGTNLNDITEVGMYYNPSNAETETMHNVPYRNSFSLLVERHAGTKQTFTVYHNSFPYTYIRNYYSGTWGSWKRVAFISYGTGNPGNLMDGEIYIKY